VNWVEIACLVGGVYFLVLELVVVVGRRLGKPTGTWWTISQVFRRDGRQWLSIPFGWGVLSGHYFGPSLPYWRWESYVLVALGVACLLRDLGNRLLPEPAPKWVLGVVFAAGCVAGAVLWSQG
jgi:hypothetical protein